jgi:cell division protein FtsI (penicillin-binding protein 3)/stage V sporulation protein D (sporulation-specific penicillin-binding protein)
MKWNTQTRAVFVCAAFAIGFSVVSHKLLEIQVVQHEHYNEAAAANHLDTVTIEPRRGTIRDRKGDLLAGNFPVTDVVIDGALFEPAALALPILARHLGIPEKKLREKLDPEDRFIPIKNRVEEDVITAMKSDLDEVARTSGVPVRGVIYNQEFRRVYPNGHLLSHVIGFYGWDDKEKKKRGLNGIERSMDSPLKGKPGIRYIEKDARQREIVPYRGRGEPAVDGSDICLTIDLGIQTIVEEELDAAVAKYKPKAATIIFLRPNTGEVLALASRPTFDPQRLNESAKGAELNRAVSGVVEPGSTFKIVAVGGALNEGFVDLETTVFCENGKYQFAGHVLKDHKSYGTLSVLEIITQSSNIGAAKLGIQLGEERFFNYIRRFGFGQKTGIELPGEHAGILHELDEWSRVSIAQLPMGQGLSVTPLQMVTAMNVIASGGRLFAPRLVHSISSPSTKVTNQFQPALRWQVLSPRATAQLSIALEDTTSENGTATMAKVPGFRTAGKTGTAQKVDPATRRYSPDKYVVSFSGYLPADDPKICGIVLFDEANVRKEEYYGGQVAAPVFAKVAARIATYIDLQPQPGITASIENPLKFVPE